MLYKDARNSATDIAAEPNETNWFPLKCLSLSMGCVY